MNDPFDYQVLNLTPEFYCQYPNPPYTEILSKGTRPYNCLLIQSHFGYFLCIPFRSQISHKNAFFFRASKRSKKSQSGLDYTKIIIINDTKYISSTDAVVDADEYAELRLFIKKIKSDATEYVDNYIKQLSGRKIMSPEAFQRTYGYSSLQYFHKELGLPVIKSKNFN